MSASTVAIRSRLFATSSRPTSPAPGSTTSPPFHDIEAHLVLQSSCALAEGVTPTPIAALTFPVLVKDGLTVQLHLPGKVFAELGDAQLAIYDHRRAARSLQRDLGPALDLGGIGDALATEASPQRSIANRPSRLGVLIDERTPVVTATASRPRS